MYDYDSVDVGAELGYKKPFGVAFIPYVALFGDYIYNPDPSDDNDGFLVGLKVGHKKVSDKGSWQAQYQYRHLERIADLATNIAEDVVYMTEGISIRHRTEDYTRHD